MKKRPQILLLTLCVLGLLAVWAVGFKQGYEQEETALFEEQAGIVPYEQYFKQYAPLIGWDWELLAALCYEESRFNPQARSYSGAVGLMQLMPKTATRFGLNDSTIYIPECNIRAGVEYIGRLQQIFAFIKDSTENQYFVIASYNAGPAHIMDARRLAKKYGKSAYQWADHTEFYLSQLQDETYYSDTTAVQYGAFDATQTISYVRKVMRTYRRIQRTAQAQ